MYWLGLLQRLRRGQWKAASRQICIAAVQGRVRVSRGRFRLCQWLILPWCLWTLKLGHPHAEPPDLMLSDSQWTGWLLWKENVNICLDRLDLLEGGRSPTRTKFLRRSFPTNGTSPCPSAASVSSGGPARVWLSWPLVDISQHLDFQGWQARALGAHFHSQARITVWPLLLMVWTSCSGVSFSHEQGE